MWLWLVVQDAVVIVRKDKEAVYIAGVEDTIFLNNVCKGPFTRNIYVCLRQGPSYRLHPKDEEGNVFTGVCLLTGELPRSPVRSPVLGPVGGGTP